MHSESQKLHSSYLVATLLPSGDFGRYTQEKISKGNKMEKIKLFVILFLLFSLFACSEKNENSLSPEELSTQYNDFKNEITSDLSPAKITLERTMCYGTCPIYSLAIYEDGTVEYFGHQYVNSVGLYKSSISKSSLNTLISFATSKGYSDLLNEYYTVIDTAEDGSLIEIQISDLPTKISSLKLVGKRKIVKNYYGAPKWLSEFETKIDSVVNVIKWVGN